MIHPLDSLVECLAHSICLLISVPRFAFYLVFLIRLLRIRLLRRDLLFLSLAPSRRSQPHPMMYSEGSPISLYIVIYLTLRF